MAGKVVNRRRPTRPLQGLDARKENDCMQPRFTPGTTALLLLGVVGGLTISASRLLGQTNDSGAFAYIRAIPQQQQTPPASGLPNGPATAAQVLRGRYLVTTSACASCHSHDVVD